MNETVVNEALMSETFIRGLLLCSVILAGLAVALFIKRIICALYYKKSSGSRITGCVLLLIIAVWCIRFAVGYYSSFHPNDYMPEGLTWFEEFFNSLIHTFQSFSMDESYTEYIGAGKEMVKAVYKESEKAACHYGLYASVLNVLAPICGGVILLDILQGTFPKVKLFFKRSLVWKKEYYFSELNNNSLTCAKSILEQNHGLFCRPIIVFTDVYTDGENEQSSELFRKAKALGCICVTDDLTHLNHRHTTNKEYWLIDNNEINNIKTLAVLADDTHYRRIEKTVIRIFYQDDSYTLTEASIVQRLRELYMHEFNINADGKALTNPDDKFYKKIRLKYELSRVLSDDVEKKKAKKGGNKNKGKNEKERKDESEKTLKKERKKEERAAFKRWLLRFVGCGFNLNTVNDKLLDQYCDLTYKKDSGQTKEQHKDKSAEKMNKEAKESYINKKVPAVIRTRFYQDLIYNLLKEVPLYKPLLNCKNPEKLNVTILGNGNIGMEMLLASSWCGQLYDIPLSINMVSKDEPEAAIAKINKISTEILESTKEGSDLLKVYSEVEKYNAPYFKFRYCCYDMDFDDFSDLTFPVFPDGAENTEKEPFYLTDADYYLVALGDDDLNIRVAERLYKAVALSKREDKTRKVVITYVVYDSHLCRILNKTENDYKQLGFIEMRAVGSIEDTFSYKSIVKEEYMAKRLDENGTVVTSHGEWAELSSKMAMSGKPYEFWSTYARELHYEYKVFSAFAKRKDTDCTWENWKKCHEEYICEPTDNEADELAWLEHRRWNAYMRSIGFIFDKNKDVKVLKTHDCLVEHHKPGEEEAGYEDYLEKVKKRDPKIINYDYVKIISDEEYYKII